MTPDKTDKTPSPVNPVAKPMYEDVSRLLTAVNDPCTKVRPRKLRKLRAFAVKLARGNDQDKTLAASLHGQVERLESELKQKATAGAADRKPQNITTTNTVRIGSPA